MGADVPLGNMEACRVACVGYLNTAPLVEGLERVEGLHVERAVPSRIVGMVQGGGADVGLASIVDAVRSGGALSVLRCGMIGCDGPTLTVRVFSADPWEAVRVLHADTDSHTSVVLARLMLEQVHGRRVEVKAFDARERQTLDGSGNEAEASGSLEEAWPRTVLLIGDKVVTDPPPANRYPYQMDLGEAWKDWTGLPFVYAAWMCRTEDVASRKVRTAAALLDRQRRHNMTRLGWIAAQRGPAARWPVETAARYLGSLLRYDLDARAALGAERFVKEAGERGLLDSQGLVWAKDEVQC